MKVLISLVVVLLGAFPLCSHAQPVRYRCLSELNLVYSLIFKTEPLNSVEMTIHSALDASSVTRQLLTPFEQTYGELQIHTVPASDCRGEIDQLIATLDGRSYVAVEIVRCKSGDRAFEPYLIVSDLPQKKFPGGADVTDACQLF
ncbi:MAG: hypothetical protein EOP09_03310 [Proteobacteria bacterium]|nr:MAG: hypothetical protein EOP09_03310 [Pseudomonadota bacterium]